MRFAQQLCGRSAIAACTLGSVARSEEKFGSHKYLKLATACRMGTQESPDCTAKALALIDREGFCVIEGVLSDQCMRSLTDLVKLRVGAGSCTEIKHGRHHCDLMHDVKRAAVERQGARLLPQEALPGGLVRWRVYTVALRSRSNSDSDSADLLLLLCVRILGTNR